MPTEPVSGEQAEMIQAIAADMRGGYERAFGQKQPEPESPEQTREWSILEHFHACGLAAQNQREKRSAPEFWDTSPI